MTCKLDRSRTGTATRALMNLLFDRGELSLAECADGADITTSRAGTILFGAAERKHVIVRVVRCAVRYYRLTDQGRDAVSVLRQARERLRQIRSARTRSAAARAVA